MGTWVPLMPTPGWNFEVLKRSKRLKKIYLVKYPNIEFFHKIFFRENFPRPKNEEDPKVQKKSQTDINEESVFSDISEQ